MLKILRISLSAFEGGGDGAATPAAQAYERAASLAQDAEQQRLERGRPV